MLIDIKETAALLEAEDNIVILTHASPDGDTLGSAYALLRALKNMGKHAKVVNSDIVPNRYNYLFSDIADDSFTPSFIVAVDVADTALLGDEVKEKYVDKIALCIDHHGSNKLYAAKTLLDADASSTAEVILALLHEMNVEITKDIADGIYTGVSTDTGGFRFGNTTSRSLRTAAEMVDAGADNKSINIAMFETRSFPYIELERLGLEGLTLYFDGKAAIITLTQEMFKKSGYDGQECDSICAIPRQIEGVKVGATIKEKANGSYKISVRTNDPFDASAICGRLGGGGHRGAAGCEMKMSLEEVKAALLCEIKKALDAQAENAGI